MGTAGGKYAYTQLLTRQLPTVTTASAFNMAAKRLCYTLESCVNHDIQYNYPAEDL